MSDREKNGWLLAALVGVSIYAWVFGLMLNDLPPAIRETSGSGFPGGALLVTAVLYVFVLAYRLAYLAGRKRGK